MFPSILTKWPRRPMARYGLMMAVWIGANVLVVGGIEHWEARQLANQFQMPSSIIRQYQSRRLRIPTTDSQQEETSLWYRFRPPGYWTGRHEVPLLVYLHGSGDRGSDNVQQLCPAPSVMCEPRVAEQFPCAVLAPQCPEGFNWSSRINSETDMLDVLLKMIDEVLLDTRIDPQRIYLTGFSMGGFGAWALAARAPERFAAVVPIAGGGDPSLAEHLIDLPLWAVHGAADEVVSVTQSQVIIAAIKKAGGQPRFSDLPEAGHQTWPVVFHDDSRILKWMFRKRRGGTAARHYW